MNAFDRNPRLLALVMVVAGAAVVSLVVAIGGMESGGRSGGKAILAVGLGGVAFGTGLIKLLWPPAPKTDPNDDRTFFGRASWPQKTLYILGGLIGITAAAILQTWANGKI